MTDRFEEACLQVDEAMSHWRQGDCLPTDEWFVHRYDPEAPLTRESRAVASAGGYLCESVVRGFMVATQTCDIVRPSSTRPFVEVVPLVAVDPHHVEEIRRGRRPRYAYVSGTAGERLVADLDRAMTVEKAVAAGWKRRSGCDSDEDRRLLARALARNRSRVAFPDDFIRLVAALRDRIVEKHDKRSREGGALRSLREIRVKAAPDWRATKVDILFLFILDDEHLGSLEPAEWPQILEASLSLVPAIGRFVTVEGIVASLDDLTARDYVESDILDLDHLS